MKCTRLWEDLLADVRPKAFDEQLRKIGTISLKT